MPFDNQMTIQISDIQLLDLDLSAIGMVLLFECTLFRSPQYWKFSNEKLCLVNLSPATCEPLLCFQLYYYLASDYMLTLFEASSHDQINMTEFRLQHDRKFFRTTSVNNWTWPKNIFTIYHRVQNPMSIYKYMLSLRSLIF